jgi:hypothetical protein
LPTADLVPGEIAVDTDYGGAGNPQAFIRRAATWAGFMWVTGVVGGTDDQVPKFDATGFGLEDSNLSSEGVPAATTDGDLVDLEGALTAQDAGNTIRGFHVDLEQPAGGHLGAAEVVGILVDVSADDAASAEQGIRFTNAFDSEIYFEGRGEIQFPAGGAMALGNVDDDNGWVITDVGDAASGAYFEAEIADLGIMDNNDTLSAITIDVTNSNHAGAGNVLYGLFIDDIVADPQAVERAINIGQAWDVGIRIDTTGMAAAFQLTAASVFNFWASLEFSEGVGATAPTTLMLQEFPDTVADFADTYMVGVGDGTDTIAAMDGSDTYAMLKIDFTNADHTGSSNNLYAISIDGITGDAQASEYGLYFGEGWDIEIYTADSQAIWRFANNSEVVIADQGSKSLFYVRDNNAATLSVDATEVDLTLAAMNGGDTVRALLLDIINADHTGTGNSLYGLAIDGIAGDPDATQYAIHLDDTGWNSSLFIEGTAEDIDHGITAVVQFNPTLAANDNANDQRNVLLIDVDVPNGSAGLVNAINIDGITDDPNTIDAAIFVEGGWDGALHITERGGVATTNALANSVLMYVDDSADYSGAGGNDCAVVFRDAAGNMGSVIVNLNAACP